MLNEEESRSNKKIINIPGWRQFAMQRLQAEIVNNKIIKQFPDMPSQWIAAAHYILFSAISSYLQTANHLAHSQDSNNHQNKLQSIIYYNVFSDLSRNFTGTIGKFKT